MQLTSSGQNRKTPACHTSTSPTSVSYEVYIKRGGVEDYITFFRDFPSTRHSRDTKPVAALVGFPKKSVLHSMTLLRETSADC